MGKWRSFYCHLPCGWLRLSTKNPVSLSRFRRGARGRVARRGIPAPPTPTAGAWLRKVALLCGRRPDDGDVAWGGGMWRVGCLPPNYQHLPVPYSPPFTRLPTGVGVWERRGAETARSGGVWWGTHLKWMEPHHRRCYMPCAPLLWRPVSSPCMHAGVLVGPGRERRAWRTAPARRLTGQDAGPYPWKRRGPKGGRSRRPRAPDPRGSACGHRTPPLTWTLPSRTLPLLHNPRSTTRTPDPLFTLDTLFYYFCLIKASPRPDATPTVSVVCVYIYIYIHTNNVMYNKIIMQLQWNTCIKIK